MQNPTTNPCRIGCASGFWGDSSMGAPQLVRSGQIDYLVFDYLAELTMSILAAQRLKNPDAGYATDFVSVTCKQVLAECLKQGIRIISNAGGVNPQACGKALQALAEELGLSVKIAVVTGDDVMPLVPALREAGVREFNGKRPLPDRLLTANAYLGAAPIAHALGQGADVVITGRCVDSAVTLGALMHHFVWDWSDWDKLAQASLAGHIIECGAQGTGGLFTDWADVPDWANMGYPIVEVSADGSFVTTKPEGTGGLVNCAVVAEQLLYEIHDPQNYVLPDVVCDFSLVQLKQVGNHRVWVGGAIGKPAPSQYKVSATFVDGYKCTVQLAIIGFDAAAKARRTSEALLERIGEMFKQLGLPPFSATNAELLGTENAYGPHGQTSATREVILRLSVRHPVKQALELFAREIAAPGTSFAPGTTGMDGGRPSVNPAVCQFAFLIEKAWHPEARVGGDIVVFAKPEPIPKQIDPQVHEGQHSPKAEPVLGSGDMPGQSTSTSVPLIAIAHGRSGDKGDTSNIGIRARHPDLLVLIAQQVTAQKVAEHLAHHVKGKVTRYQLPGIQAFNFVCQQALGGGGMASLRHDPLGKAMAQLLLSMPIQVPQHLMHLCYKRYK